MFLSLFNHHKHSSHNLFKFKKSHTRDDAHSHADKFHGHFDQLIQDLSHRVFEFKKEATICEDKPVVLQKDEEEKSEGSSEGQKLSQEAMLLAEDGAMISDTPNSEPAKEEVLSVEEIIAEEEILAPVEDIAMVMRETEVVAEETSSMVSENPFTEVAVEETSAMVSENPVTDVAVEETSAMVSENPVTDMLVSDEVMALESIAEVSVEAPMSDVLNEAPAALHMDMATDHGVHSHAEVTAEVMVPSPEVMALEALAVEAVAEEVVSAEVISPEVMALEAITEVAVEPTLELTTGEVVTDAGVTGELPQALPLEAAPMEEPQIAEETSEMLPDVTIQTLTEEAPVDNVILQNVAPSTEDDDIVLEDVVEPTTGNCFQITINDHGFNKSWSWLGDYKSSWGSWSDDKQGACDFIGDFVNDFFKSWGGDHHTADAELCQ